MALRYRPNLKAWMKKNHTVQLSGTDFTRALTADDIVDMPEFYNAYMLRNSGYEGSWLPQTEIQYEGRSLQS